MIITHKIALRPNKSQLPYLNQHAGYARYAYNTGLADFKEGLDEGIFHSKYDLRKRFNASKPDWARAHSQNAAKYALVALGESIQSWISKKSGFPKFKKKGQKDSFRVDNGPDTVRIEGKRIKLPKLGWIKMFERLRFAGRILEVTISRTAHRWFASVCVDTPMIYAKSQSNIIVGIDVGINHLATLSDGTTYDAPKPLKHYLRKLRRLSKAHSRKVFGSKNRRKSAEKLARLHYRIACIREDFHHKNTTVISKAFGMIGIESLNVSGMIKNRRLSRALTDVGIGEFLRMLKYKASIRDVKIVEADRWFPSSKTCSQCGHIKDSLGLGQREYVCEACNLVVDRDLNAALNLEQVAASLTETKNACGEDVRLQLP
jgi:putative transposase